MNQKAIFESFQKLKSLPQTGSGIDIELARQLYFQKKNDNFKAIMGDEEATWKSFVGQPELQPLSISKAERLIKIYAVYIVKLKLSPEDVIGIDSNSLQRIASLVNQNNVSAWIAKAKRLSRADLFREIKYGQVDPSSCSPHKFKEKVTSICVVCGTKKT